MPGPGEPDDVWWLGFDCGHGFDLMPAMDAAWRKIGDIMHGGLGAYRDLAYARAETERLAEQLIAARAQ